MKFPIEPELTREDIEAVPLEESEVEKRSGNGLLLRRWGQDKLCLPHGRFIKFFYAEHGFPREVGQYYHGSVSGIWYVYSTAYLGTTDEIDISNIPNSFEDEGDVYKAHLSTATKYTQNGVKIGEWQLVYNESFPNNSRLFSSWVRRRSGTIIIKEYGLDGALSVVTTDNTKRCRRTKKIFDEDGSVVQKDTWYYGKERFKIPRRITTKDESYSLHISKQMHGWRYEQEPDGELCGILYNKGKLIKKVKASCI